MQVTLTCPYPHYIVPAPYYAGHVRMELTSTYRQTPARHVLYYVIIAPACTGLQSAPHAIHYLVVWLILLMVFVGLRPIQPMAIRQYM